MRVLLKRRKTRGIEAASYHPEFFEFLTKAVLEIFIIRCRVLSLFLITFNCGIGQLSSSILVNTLLTNALLFD